MLRALLRRLLPQPITRTDPVLGALLFQAMPDPSRSYWEARCRFAPVDAEIEAFVDAGVEGPGDEQRALYLAMQARFAELQQAVAPLLARSYAEWLQREPPADVWDRFTLTSVSVPRRETPDFAWDLGFDCRDDANRSWTVCMRGWRPEGNVVVDG